MLRNLSLNASSTRILFCHDHAFQNGGREYPQIEGAAKALAGTFGLNVFEFEGGHVHGSDGSLFAVNTERPQANHALLICGGMLEFSVTQAAFQALLEGLDVCVLADQVATSQPSYLDYFVHRLRYRSVQFVTTLQAEYEMNCNG